MFEPYQKEEIVLCAAIHYKDGRSYDHQPNNIESGFVIAGYRHHNCFLTAKILSIDSVIDVEKVSGFLTSKHNFLTREEAAKLARKTGRFNKDTDVLFSEDLY